MQLLIMFVSYLTALSQVSKKCTWFMFNKFTGK